MDVQYKGVHLSPRTRTSPVSEGRTDGTRLGPFQTSSPVSVEPKSFDYSQNPPLSRTYVIGSPKFRFDGGPELPDAPVLVFSLPPAATTVTTHPRGTGPVLKVDGGGGVEGRRVAHVTLTTLPLHS